MSGPVLFDIVVSPLHPDFSSLYKELGFTACHFPSERKAIQGLKQYRPDVVVADFIYGYGNNYAGVNVCNLDVFYHSLQMQSPQAQRIVFVDKTELQYVTRLDELFPLRAALGYPVREQDMRACLQEVLQTSN